MKRTLIQFGCISFAMFLACLDAAKPGYGQFYNVVDALPWKSEAISLFSTTCKRSHSVDVSQFSWLVALMQDSEPTSHDLELLFGQPDCRGEKDGLTVISWDGKRLNKLAADYTLRISYNKENQPIKFEVLK